MQLARRLAVLLTAAAGLAASAAPAVAASQPAAGTFAEGPATYLTDRMVGDDEVVTLTRQVEFTGTYDGSGQAAERIVIHPDGTADVQIAIHFAGLACGRSARLVFLIAAQSDLVESVVGRYVVLDRGQVRGSGRFDAVPDVGGPYQGSAQC
jgi:hypothetical protein